MPKSRLEAFSDGVIAILITIMVLELHVPHGTDLEALRPLMPVFLTYLMSFIYLAIYWNNHHHMFHAVDHIHGGSVLWANMHLLFWLSLIPFVTGWMGENHFASLPTAVYGAVLLGAGIAYTILQTVIVRAHGGERLKAAVGRDFKGKLSVLAYTVAIPMAFVNQWVSDALYVTVALIWLVPDARIERMLAQRREAGD